MRWNRMRKAKKLRSKQWDEKWLKMQRIDKYRKKTIQNYEREQLEEP